MKTYYWYWILLIVVNHNLIYIKTNMNFNQEYFRHIKSHQTYSNYKKEKEAVKDMLKDFQQLNHYDKHR